MKWMDIFCLEQGDVSPIDTIGVEEGEEGNSFRTKAAVQAQHSVWKPKCIEDDVCTRDDATAAQSREVGS